MTTSEVDTKKDSPKMVNQDMKIMYARNGFLLMDCNGQYGNRMTPEVYVFRDKQELADFIANNFKSPEEVRIGS